MSECGALTECTIERGSQREGERDASASSCTRCLVGEAPPQTSYARPPPLTTLEAVTASTPAADCSDAALPVFEQAGSISLNVGDSSRSSGVASRGEKL